MTRRAPSWTLVSIVLTRQSFADLTHIRGPTTLPRSSTSEEVRHADSSACYGTRGCDRCVRDDPGASPFSDPPLWSHAQSDSRIAVGEFQARTLRVPSWGESRESLELQGGCLVAERVKRNAKGSQPDPNATSLARQCIQLHSQVRGHVGFKHRERVLRWVTDGLNFPVNVWQ